jgi:hypothetical protein
VKIDWDKVWEGFYTGVTGATPEQMRKKLLEFLVEENIKSQLKKKPICRKGHGER